MKKMMIAGGWLGFALGTISGLLTRGSTWPGILLRASVAAVVVGLLLRWYGGVLARCVLEAKTERAEAAPPSKPLSGIPGPTRR